MICMDEFSAKDICAIIKTCCQSNVLEITIGGLKVTFSGNIREDATPSLDDSSFAPTRPTMPSESTALPEGPLLPPDGRLLSQEEREIIEELQNSQLMFDDPEAYEQQQIDKFLGNGAALDA